MILRIFILFLFCFSFLFSEEIPVAFKGRFRPIEAYARLWLYDVYHAEQLKPEDWTHFQTDTGSPIDLILRFHLFGYHPFINSPLFWISSTELKHLLHLNPSQDRFSYQQLREALFQPQALQQFLLYHFLKNQQTSSYRYEKSELKDVSPGLWVQFDGEDVRIQSVPTSFPWNRLRSNQILAIGIRSIADHWLKQQKKSMEELSSLYSTLHQFESFQGAKLPLEKAFIQYFNQLNTQSLPPKQIEQYLERFHPLEKRLRLAGSLLKVLPSRSNEWLSLHALHVQVYQPQINQLASIGNFTRFTDEDFDAIQTAYFKWEQAMLKQEGSINAYKEDLFVKLIHAYKKIAGTSYQEAFENTLHYPSLFQLKLESFYYQAPFIQGLLFLYAFAFVLLIFRAKWGMRLLFLAFVGHTSLLILRTLILNRPPVSNMFETVIYVPWIAVSISFVCRYVYSNNLILIASSLASIILLILIEITQLNSHLENVQAVLNSQFWLMTHVLMVVGSYGVFVLGGVLGHFYLGMTLLQRQHTATLSMIERLILQTMYMGTALLVSGTILGGIWAAESWGRFWDWDPKESWAFISSCMYLLWIHAYHFRYIHSFGLAVGSVMGWLTISFTWYGVNYILGSGLHSYGFGSGGAGYYYLFLIADLLFVTYSCWQHHQLLKKSAI